MAFTDRFIKLPIKVYSEKEKSLTGNTTYQDSYVKISPFEIAGYRPQVDEANDIDECVNVSLKNGESFNVYLTVKEFEYYVNKHSSVS